MKKLNSTFIFIAIMLNFNTVSNAQHKLSIGDFWVYSYEYTEAKYSIIDTSTFFDSLLYFEFHGDSRLIPQLSKMDIRTSEIVQSFKRRKKNGFFENLVIYQNPPDTILTEDVFYKYNAQLGDKWVYRIAYYEDSTVVDTSWAEVVDVFDGIQFGKWRTIKKVTYWTGFDFSKYFCDDFGELSEENYFGMVSFLKGCFIDGIAYGDTSFIPVSVQDNKNNINNFSLMQNYPNPFNPSTIISYSVPHASNVKIIIYDILGEEITTLIDKYHQTGSYKIAFNPTTTGLNLTSGIYFYSFISDNFIQTKKMIYLR